LHELVHPLVQTDFPRAPSWFEEGIAALFEKPVFDPLGELHGGRNWRSDRLDAALAPEDAAGEDPSARALRAGRPGDRWAGAGPRVFDVAELLPVARRARGRRPVAVLTGVERVDRRGPHRREELRADHGDDGGGGGRGVAEVGGRGAVRAYGAASMATEACTGAARRTDSAALSRCFRSRRRRS
jgi:hypothetical protein